ncbi:MAG: hypothetical protein AB1758_10335 [Candidatus Eremiobacterota bacterium]
MTRMLVNPIFPSAFAVYPLPASGPIPTELDSLSRVEDYARTPTAPLAGPKLPAPSSQPPASWPSEAEIAALQAAAATDVPDESLRGAEAEHFDSRTRRDIAGLQQRQAEAEGTACLHRPVHRRQLFGGAVEVHWNPAFRQLFTFFGQDLSQGLIRFSDASNEANPDGASMFGMALELYGSDGKATDILLTGGSPRAEASQARDPEAQMALFNMINHPCKLQGLGRIAWEVGPVSGMKMLLDVKKMRTDLDSLANLTAWSRAPFALQGKDGKEYLVKLRTVPVQETTPLTAQGATTSDRLVDEFAQRARQGDTRWRLEVQFMRPEDDPNDARETWSGPWVAAGEVVVPRSGDPAEAKRLWNLAHQTRFSVWKNKEAGAQAADRDVLRPWGEMNRARHAAYMTAGLNRNCPFLQQAGTP